MSGHRPSGFVLVRDEDVTGISGTGVVAEGAEFTDGTCVIRWLGENPSTVIWPSLTSAMRVHGHGGNTQVHWVGFLDAAKTLDEAAKSWPLDREHRGAVAATAVPTWLRERAVSMRVRYRDEPYRSES